MWPIGPSSNWVGDERELGILRAGVEALARGEGAAVWVEGEPGIGKLYLVAQALAAANQWGLDVGWGIADKLTERLPLAVMLVCLEVRRVRLTHGGRMPPTCSVACRSDC